MKEHKDVIITGGARGIGRAISERFHKAGWKVVIHYNQSDTEANQLAEQLGGETVQSDLSDVDDVNRLVEYIQQDSPDAFINNAGIIGAEDPGLLTREEIDRVLTVNFSSAALLAEAAAESMGKGSSIVNITSIRGLFYSSRPGISTYCASKAALDNLTRSLAQHYAPAIRINAVAPGFTRTDMTAGVDEETRQAVEGKTPLARFGEPDEIARAVYFLASEDASYITGESLVVDGGLSIAG